MLMPDHIKPENSIYYNGALVLQKLQVAQRITLTELYCKVREERSMSFSTFLLCLDWLYLINCAVVSSGEVILCS
jgi:hypothetical protein